MMEVFYMILEAILAGIGITVGLVLTFEILRSIWRRL